MIGNIIQFGYKYQEPPVKAQVVDCRIIPNPWSPGISDVEAKHRVTSSGHFERLVARAVQLIAAGETVWIGCTFGRHRSGAVAEEVAKRTGAQIRRKTGI